MRANGELQAHWISEGGRPGGGEEVRGEDGCDDVGQWGPMSRRRSQVLGLDG